MSHCVTRAPEISGIPVREVLRCLQWPTVPEPGGESGELEVQEGPEA